MTTIAIHEVDRCSVFQHIKKDKQWDTFKIKIRTQEDEVKTLEINPTIISISSEYFKDLINTDLGVFETEIPFNIIINREKNILEDLILSFLYGGDLRIEKKYLIPYLFFAEYLQIESLVTEIKEIIEKFDYNGLLKLLDEFYKILDKESNDPPYLTISEGGYFFTPKYILERIKVELLNYLNLYYIKSVDSVRLHVKNKLSQALHDHDFKRLYLLFQESSPQSDTRQLYENVQNCLKEIIDEELKGDDDTT